MQLTMKLNKDDIRAVLATVYRVDEQDVKIYVSTHAEGSGSDLHYVDEVTAKIESECGYDLKRIERVRQG